MWQVNETLAFDGKPYRVLFTETSYFYWIGIDENKGLPVKIYFDECNNWVDEGRIEKIPDPYSYLQGESWDKESSVYQESQRNYELIKPIVEGEGAFDKRIRARRLNHAITNSDKDKSTIYRLVRRYWQRGQIKNALLPDYKNSGAAGKRRNFTTSKAGRPRMYGIGSGEPVTENIRKQFRIICDKYLMNDKGYSIRYAYNKFGKAYKLKNPNAEEHEIPTLRQFQYFYKTEYNQATQLTVQTPQGNYNKDVRPLHGTATEQALGPGSRYEIDATIADIYLVDDNDSDKVIGRPTIYMVIDVFSRMVAGFYIGFDNAKEDYANIEVLQTSNFPLSAFIDSATRAILSWLLIESNAKRSFESIFRYFSTESHLDVSFGYKRWLFHFDPPQMSGWSFSYDGRLDSSGRYFLVEKITDIEINAQMPSRIYFHNPAFTHPDESEKPTVGGQGPDPYERPEDHVIDDDREASDAHHTFLLGENTCSLRFKNHFSTSKATTPKRGYRRDANRESPQRAGDAVSTNEPGSDGEVPSADMGGGMQDHTDHSEEYASRFTAFNMMVKMLQEKYACTIIDSYTHELDQVGRSKCHLIDSGAKRTIRCVVVARNGHVNYLLEVDVTGLSKWLSTKCVRQIDTCNWQEQFSRIKKGVVANSLSWPTQDMDVMFGFKKHIGISHPKSIEGHPTGIPTESILDWAGRVAEKL